jgi:hypothetical protein
MGEFSCCSYRTVMVLANIVTMIDAVHQTSTRSSRSLAQLERDAALRRVGRTRRWVIAAAAALTAGFAAVVSAIAPGRTGAHTQARALGSTRTQPGRVASTRMPPLANASDLGLQGPAGAPQATPTPSPAAPAPSQVAPSPSRATPAPAQAAPAPAPAPSAPAVVSGGS